MLNTIKAIGYLMYLWFKENLPTIFVAIILVIAFGGLTVFTARTATDRELEHTKYLRVAVISANPCEDVELLARAKQLNDNLDWHKSSLDSRFFFIRWAVSEEWRNVEPIPKVKGTFECK